jgi:branched-chain amino acid transport system permease protein
MDYIIHLIILVGIYLLLAQSFNFTMLGGLFNLSHIACYAIGAYATALLSVDYDQSLFVCLPASMLISALLALLIGAISTRLSHDYFAIGTLAFASVITALLINWKELTRGVLGIPGIPRPDFFSIDFYENNNFLALLTCLLLIVYFLLYCLFKSKLANQLKAISEHEQVSLALGIKVSRVKNISFAIASSIAGLAGGIFAYYLNYIDPSSFGLQEMVFVISIVILGRPGSFWGTIAATFFLVLLPEPLRFIDLPPSILGPMRQFLYALILFAVVYWKKEKLFPVQRAV